MFFETQEKLVSVDHDGGNQDVYERAGGATTLVSKGPDDEGNFGASFAGASADGTCVFFQTKERLVADDSDGRVDVHQRSGTSTTLLSTSSVGGNGAAYDAFFVGASADGSRVFFETGERLVAGDTDDAADVYERLLP